MDEQRDAATGALVLQNSASEDDIRCYMEQHASDFTPAFGQKMDIASYARKVRTYARTYEVWNKGSLAALLAAYLDSARGQVYVPYICAARTGMEVPGLGSMLMEELKALRFPYRYIRLEVRKTNEAARRFYAKHGFKQIEDRGEKLFMELEINKG